MRRECLSALDALYKFVGDCTGPPRRLPAPLRSELVVVRAAGPKIAFDETIGRALDGSLDRSDLTSRTAAAHMIHLLASESGGGLQYHRGDDALVLGAVLPEAEGLIG